MNTLEDQIIFTLQKVKPKINENLEKNFVADGILDSLDIMNVIMALEDDFDIEIDPEDVLYDNFVSVAAIAELVNKYIKQ